MPDLGAPFGLERIETWFEARPWGEGGAGVGRRSAQRLDLYFEVGGGGLLGSSFLTSSAFHCFKGES